MLTVVIGMLIALVLAAVVLALVAVPARRHGRQVLSSQGEGLVNQARERTADAVGAARGRVGQLADRLPVGRGDVAEPVPQTIDLSGPPTPASARGRSVHRS